MCTPTQTSSNYGSIGVRRNYSPAKQERFEAEVAKNQQQLRDKGYTPTQSGVANPLNAGTPGSALGEVLWAVKDSEKNPEVTSSPAPPTINNPEQRQTGGRSREYTLNRKNNLEVARNKKNRKTVGSGKRGPSDKIKIKKTNQVNTNETNSGGVNF